MVDTSAPLPVRGLELRTHGLWADHICEAPFEQWTVANEAYGVLLDDPADALGEARGEVAAIAVDLEWYADGDPIAAGATRAGEPDELRGDYSHRGIVHGVVELHGGTLELDAVPSIRHHRWGTHDHRTDTGVANQGSTGLVGLLAPVARPDRPLHQLLDRNGVWHRW